MRWKTNQWFPEVGLGKNLTLKGQHGVVRDEGALWIPTVAVQLPSHVQLFATPWTTAHLPFTVSWSLLKLMSIELMMPSNHLILCCPLLLLASIFHIIRVFFSESILCIRWPKYWSISISPSNEYSGLISFRIDLFDLLSVQGTLKSLQM